MQNNIIKKCFIIPMVLLLYTSCAKYAEENSSYFKTISPDRISYTNGMFYKDLTDNQMIKYADFDTLNIVPICPKPNCTHTSEKECSALGIDGSIFIHDEKLCWLTSKVEYEDYGLTDSTQLLIADIDGTNRICIAELSGLRVGSGAYVDKDDIYFCASKIGYDDYKSTGYNENYLYRYSFHEKHFEKLIMLSEGYNSGAAITGTYNGDLLICYQGTTDENNKSNYKEHRKSALYNISASDLTVMSEYVINASGDCLIYINSNSEVVVKTSAGEEILIYSDNIKADTFSDYAIINGKLFSILHACAYDLSTGKEYGLTNPSKEVITFYKGKYILKDNINKSILSIAEDEYLK